jgi:hypothetical protein
MAQRPANVAPVAQNQGFFSGVTSSIVGLFDRGLEIYGTVRDRITAVEKINEETKAPEGGRVESGGNGNVLSIDKDTVAKAGLVAAGLVGVYLLLRK